MSFPYSPEAPRFGLLIYAISQRFSVRFDALARKELGLTLAQCRVLGCLARTADRQPISQADLANDLGMSAMGIAKLCDRLEAGGWIRRIPRSSDRRVNDLALDAKAHAVLDQAYAIGDRLADEALAGLDAADRERIIRDLVQIRNRLGGSSPAPAPKA